MAKYWRSRKYKRYAKRWRSVYKKYFRKYRPRHVSLGKETAKTTISGTVSCLQYNTVDADSDTFRGVFSVCPFFNNFTGYSGVVGQWYGLCGAYGNQSLRQAFTRYQQCRLKAMYVRIRAVLAGSSSPLLGTDWMPYALWDRQSQYKEVDNRDYTSREIIGQATSQGQPMWFDNTTQIWGTKCLPKDLTERASWVSTGTQFNYHEGVGQSMEQYENGSTGTWIMSNCCQENYMSSTSYNSRSVPPAQFFPTCRLAMRVVPEHVARNYLFEISVKYVMEFRNPGESCTNSVKSYLLLNDDQLAPEDVTKSTAISSSPPIDKE